MADANSTHSPARNVGHPSRTGKSLVIAETKLRQQITLIDDLVTSHALDIEALGHAIGVILRHDDGIGHAHRLAGLVVSEAQRLAANVNFEAEEVCPGSLSAYSTDLQDYLAVGNRFRFLGETTKAEADHA